MQKIQTQPLQRRVSIESTPPLETIALEHIMIDFFIALLEFLDPLDSMAQTDGPSTWGRRNRKLIRVLYILCMLPVCVALLLLVIDWVVGLGIGGKSVVMVVVGMQLIGLFVLLRRKSNK